ncbi:MAG: molybdopterin-dependent oxidoreductase [Actinomycetota bacterium]
MEADETPVADHPRWYGALAGVLAGVIALVFGELVEGVSDTIPGLVLGMGEWIVDVTPGSLVQENIENLGTRGKSWLLPGITITALLIAALLGDLSKRVSMKIGIVGFAAFGVLGGFTAARNPQSPAFASWFWALVAAGLGVATLVFLLSRLYRPTRLAGVLEDPREKRATRRAFISWSAGAGAVAVTGLAVAGRVEGDSAAEVARGELDFTGLGDTPTTSSPLQAPITPGSFDEIEGIGSFITPNNTFYRIDTALSVPQVDPDSWSLSITGMVDNPYTLTFDEILAMDLEEHVITLSCVSNEVGGGLVGTATWLGVPITQLLDRAGVQEGATQFVGRSVDDWTAGFPTEVLDDGRNALLAVAMNGEPLPIIHGFPARLVVAGLYGYVSAVKWIEEINLTGWDDFDGYWVPRGWSKLGPMKTMSRIDVPANRSEVPAGTTAVAGVAWSPPRGIERVEVEFNLDDVWHECEIAAPGNDETWVQWKYEWDAPPGQHVLRVRAVDGAGERQPIGPKAVAPDGAEGWHVHQVRVV